jgi:putative two-component system response regulator
MADKNKILIVEDETITKVLRLKFEQSDFVVEIARDGFEALKMLDKFTPDIILLDILMPVMDGFEFMDKLKEIDRFKNIPIVIFSNFDRDVDIQKAKEAGALDYIIKVDVTMNQLVAKIKEYLDNNKK